MESGAFHIIDTSAQYDATIAFYRDGLELPVIGGWDEGPHARGTMFRAASGIIEVMAHPAEQAGAWQVFSPDLPQGLNIIFEVADVDAWYQRARAKQLSIRHPLTSFNWGHRAFTLTEPNGQIVYIFTPTA